MGPLDPVPGNLYNVPHLDIQGAPAGEVPVLITVSHEGLRGDDHHFFAVDVPPHGNDVTVKRVR